MNKDKYFDKLINRIKNPLEFNILITLSELVDNLSTEEKIELDDELKIIGVSKRYFDIINDETGWYSLSEKGLKLKELGGQLEYKKYIEEKELKNSGLNINVSNLIQGDNYGTQSSSNFSNNPHTNNINANIKPTEKKNLIRRFWKLISENKLISSVVIIIILYVVKVVFGIDLKNP
tara:strand:+ start:77 stop:607 length:531 start_codon:yes stop_codon:yes gene_type:complete